ncbi:MAG TPA: DUF3786 domain-containing protein [Nitrospirota bacterium]|nr:DUF3786 domain-containing protein [Nitrospirota bacterium]
MRTAVEIYKLLPKTNCGTCGMPTCFGFAAKVASGQASIAACATLGGAVKEEIAKEAASGGASRGTVFEQTLAALRPKVAGLDFSRVARDFGADLVAPDRIEIEFLNERFIVTKERITGPSGAEPPAFISILICNHLCMPDPPPVSGEWVTFSAVPAAHAKDKAWAGHVEDVIANRFSGDVEGLKAACERLGGKKADVKGNHDAAYEFRFFPRYPALLLFYDAVPEEGFPAQCKLLLDRNAPRYLDIESMVVLGEEFAERLVNASR